MALFSQLKQLLSGDGDGERRPATSITAAYPVSERVKQAAAKMAVGLTPVDSSNLHKLLAFLEKTPSGWADVEHALAWRVTVSFNTAEGGALYSRPNNHITLSRTRVPRSLAVYFVHEATHARMTHAGTFGDTGLHTKAQFAEAIVCEETETYLREAVVGRELLHYERARGVPDWAQSLNDHMLQMWFALVHGVRYHKRPSDEVLAKDAAFDAATLEQKQQLMRPYVRRYVEPYRVVQYVKWDIANRLRPPIDSETSQGLLSASFEKQLQHDRCPYVGVGPKPPPVPAPQKPRQKRGDGFG